MDEKQVAEQFVGAEPCRITRGQTRKHAARQQENKKKNNRQMDGVDAQQAAGPKISDFRPGQAEMRMHMGQNEPRQNKKPVDAKVAMPHERRGRAERGCGKKLQIQMVKEHPCGEQSATAGKVINSRR